MKARRKIVARVVDAGKCRYYRTGREFILNGFTPQGLCDSAYAALSRDAQTLAYGGTLPWAAGGIVTTRCPDPHGAIWELWAESPSEEPRNGTVRRASDGVGAEVGAAFAISTCRGLAGRCRFSLVDKTPLLESLHQMLEQIGWEDFLRRQIAGPILPHHQLRVAIAACPNGCSQPQIKDIGLVANVQIAVDGECNGCGQCVAACHEGGVVVEADRAAVRQDLCVGCGQCATACPSAAMRRSPVAFQLLVGGRLGRHPRWADVVLPDLAPSTAVGAVNRVVTEIVRESRPGERFSTTAERIGPQRLGEMAQEGRHCDMLPQRGGCDAHVA